MRARLALYKGPGDWTDRAIRWYTNSPYSHVELVAGGWWYSTSPRDLKLRRKQIWDNKGHWDYVDVEVDAERLNRLFKEYEGCSYDWLGIVGIALWKILPFVHMENPKKLFCSEWGSMALGLDKPWTYSPGRLYREMNNEVK